MIIQCESCSRKFVVKDSDIPSEGRTVQCGYCSVTWHQMPNLIKSKKVAKQVINEPQAETNDNLSVESIKASDGKTYKFLGSQWAELLPSGKTGLFAKKKIGKELDKLTGRKRESSIDKKKKKVKKELDPSGGSINNEKQLPDLYKPREGLGFFGYVLLIIIIGFSFVGVAKTFEDDLLNNFPQFQYYYDLLDKQLNYLAESVKNIIVIINDLLVSY
tara:strand:- start:3949 stop:4599 length:651 start_codon:yes stop_codon:yes gene_type:complete